MALGQARQSLRLLLIVVGGMAAGVVLAFAIVGAPNFDSGSLVAGQDARGYWYAVRVDQPYGSGAGTFGAYLYSPAFMQLLSPVLTLPWDQFLAVWMFLLMAAMLTLTGPLLFVMALPLAFFELWGGNIHLLLGLAIVAGLRWPVAWAFVLLTKITPGVGLVWFVARREWRSLAIALGATGSVVALSWLIDHGLWTAWLDLLLRQAAEPQPAGSISIPLPVRMPLAVALVWVAGRTGRRWLLVVGTTLALPVLWWGSLSLLIGALAFERSRIEAWLFLALEKIRLRAVPAGGMGPRWATEPDT